MQEKGATKNLQIFCPKWVGPSFLKCMALLAEVKKMKGGKNHV
jgi:hypothetical protein